MAITNNSAEDLARKLLAYLSTYQAPAQIYMGNCRLGNIKLLFEAMALLASLLQSGYPDSLC